MNINEQIRKLREETGYSRKEFSEHFGIPVRTMEEWESGRRTPPEYVVRLLDYYIRYDKVLLLKNNSIGADKGKRNISIIEDLDGKKTVVIHDILFKGKRKINWKEVEKYLEQYIGDICEITEYADKIYIGKDFPDEYAGSKDTERLRGTQAKAKANAAQGIPELIQIANKKRFKENKADKHNDDAKYGWYRYDTKFALPIYNESGNVGRYNIFRVELIIRHDYDEKMYLYDVVNIKKETSTPLKQ